jgi:DNA-binding transcriptional MocR family regulator
MRYWSYMKYAGLAVTVAGQGRNMPSKVEQVADRLRSMAAEVAPGEQVSSVEALMDELGVSIGTVVRGVDRAISSGVPIDRRRGSEGGYFLKDGRSDVTLADANVPVEETAEGRRAVIDDVVLTVSADQQVIVVVPAGRSITVKAAA